MSSAEGESKRRDCTAEQKTLDFVTKVCHNRRAHRVQFRASCARSRLAATGRDLFLVQLASSRCLPVLGSPPFPVPQSTDVVDIMANESGPADKPTMRFAPGLMLRPPEGLGNLDEK